MDELLRDFLTEANEQLAEAESLLVRFERTPSDSSLVASIFRLVHTIKGTSSFIGLVRLQSVAHCAETLLGRMRDGEPPTEQGVSLVLSSIDHIRDLLHDIEANEAEPEGDSSAIIAAIDDYLLNGAASVQASPTVEQAPAAPEVLDPEPAEPAAQAADESAAEDTSKAIAKAPRAADAAETRGNGQAGGGETIRVSVATLESVMQLVSELVLARNQLNELTRHSDNDALKVSLQRLAGLTSDLQDAVMRTRMQPVSRLFGSLPRLVRELSLDLGKKIELVTEGGDTELDRQLIEVIRDPLTHIIRNCADHGLETAEQRVAAGKSPQGEIRIRAYQEAGQFVIEIADDGRGVDLERVKAKAVASKLVREADLAGMTDAEISRFIFEPGFSTAAAVTNVSGRGVGMDVVRSNIESVRGSVELATTKGRGTRLNLRIPLTLAIAPALIVEAAGQRFALPQHSVAEVVEARRGANGTIRSVQDKLVVDLRGEVMPAAEMPNLLGITRPGENAAQSELVVVMRASTSSVGLLVDAVVDVQDIVVKPLSRPIAHLEVFSGQTILGDGSVLLILDPAGIARKLNVAAAAHVARQRGQENDSAALSTRMVMFSTGDGIEKLLPTSIIARIEQVKLENLKRSEIGVVMPYQGTLIPVIELAPSTHTDTVPVIVVSVAGVLFGLSVMRIFDIVEDTVEIDVPSEDGATLGTCRVNGHVVDLLDPMELLDRARAVGARAAVDKSKSVLLLTGDARAIDLVRPLVKAAGYHVTVAQSATAVSALANTQARVDAVLLDLDVPVPDSAELANISEWIGRAPVIGLTRDGDNSGNAGSAKNPNVSATAGFDRRQILHVLKSNIAAA